MILLTHTEYCSCKCFSFQYSISNQSAHGYRGGWDYGYISFATRRLCNETSFIDLYIKQGHSPDHCVLGIPNKLLPLGFKGIEETARATMSKLSFDNAEDQEKIEFLRGVILCCIKGEPHDNIRIKLY